MDGPGHFLERSLTCYHQVSRCQQGPFYPVGEDCDLNSVIAGLKVRAAVGYCSAAAAVVVAAVVDASEPFSTTCKQSILDSKDTYKCL